MPRNLFPPFFLKYRYAKPEGVSLKLKHFTGAAPVRSIFLTKISLKSLLGTHKVLLFHYIYSQNSLNLNYYVIYFLFSYFIEVYGHFLSNHNIYTVNLNSIL